MPVPEGGGEFPDDVDGDEPMGPRGWRSFVVWAGSVISYVLRLFPDT